MWQKLKGMLIACVGVYVALVTVLYVFQDKFIYFPSDLRVDPALVRFDAQEIELRTPDDQMIIAWWRPPAAGQPVILYFHGNAGGLQHRAERYKVLTADGQGIFAMSYRGYSGSTGKPSEINNIADATQAYEWLTKQGVPPEQIVIYGESLGTGIAIQTAAKNPVRALVLEAPYTSTSAIARSQFPYYLFPIKTLMRDQYRSDLFIGEVTAPVLVMHGVGDRTIPYRFGTRLYSMINARRALKTFTRGTHDNLYALGADQVVAEFIGNPETSAISSTSIASR